MDTKRFTLLSGTEFVDSKKYSWSIGIGIGRTGNIYKSNIIRIYLMADYYLKNKEKIKQQSIIWNKNNKKRKAENGKKWYKNNIDISISRSVEWNKENIEKRRKISAKYSRINSRKHKARRRSMGFIELNKKFLESHAHHVDNEQVIYIPESLHRSVPHNLKTGKGMQKINVLAFKYLFGGVVYS